MSRPRSAPVDVLRPERLLSVVEALVGPVEGLMLYGSHARNTAGPDSDVDLLALVGHSPRDVRAGELNVTAYAPGHLLLLAQRGSLFVRHLRQDGQILHDPAGLLEATLDAFRPPRDENRLSVELAATAAGLLSATADDVAQHGREMRALAYYVIRTAVYDRCVRAGHPEFDLQAALAATGLTRLKATFSERRLAYTEVGLVRVMDGLRIAFPSASGRFAGLAAATVGLADARPLASDLLASVLVGDAVPYTALTLPPG